MESNQELMLEYTKWGFIVIATILLFKLFSRKFGSSMKLFLATFLPVWLTAGIFLGLQYSQKGIGMIYSLDGFILLLIESLPVTLLFSGLTFAKLNRDRKKKINAENTTIAADDSE